MPALGVHLADTAKDEALDGSYRLIAVPAAKLVDELGDQLVGQNRRHRRARLSFSSRAPHGPIEEGVGHSPSTDSTTKQAVVAVLPPMFRVAARVAPST